MEAMIYMITKEWILVVESTSKMKRICIQCSHTQITNFHQKQAKISKIKRKNKVQRIGLLTLTDKEVKRE